MSGIRSLKSGVAGSSPAGTRAHLVSGAKRDAIGNSSKASTPPLPPAGNPGVQAFKGVSAFEGAGGKAQGASESGTKTTVNVSVKSPPIVKDLDEAEARAVSKSWKDKGAYETKDTGAEADRRTRKYHQWRERVDAFLAAPPKGTEGKLEEWRRWREEHEAYARWDLRKSGEAPKAPGSIPSELAEHKHERVRLGEPPAKVFRQVSEYEVKLPDGTQYSFRDDPVAPDYKNLLHENGVAKLGTKISRHTDVDELFTAAGIDDATERKVMKKVSEAEGGFEAVNTYDTGHVSAGFIQFISDETGTGSLARLLKDMKSDAPDDFKTSFRSLGIDVDKQGLKVAHPESGALLRGSEAVKAIVEDKRLLAVFHHAGKTSQPYQIAQLKLAKEMYYLPAQEFSLSTEDQKTPVSLTGKYGDVLKSEAGKVAIMDRAVQLGRANAKRKFQEAAIQIIQEHKITTVEELAKYEALIIPHIQNMNKGRHRVLEDVGLSQPEPVPPPLPQAAAGEAAARVRRP
jgi:hypothetical protein